MCASNLYQIAFQRNIKSYSLLDVCVFVWFLFRWKNNNFMSYPRHVCNWATDTTRVTVKTIRTLKFKRPHREVREQWRTMTINKQNTSMVIHLLINPGWCTSAGNMSSRLKATKFQRIKLNPELNFKSDKNVSNCFRPKHMYVGWKEFERVVIWHL